MGFADWVKRSDLAATALSRHQNMREVLQAAFKAGERQGRSDAEALEQNAVALAVLIEREACAMICDGRANRPFVDEGLLTETEWAAMCWTNEVAADAIRGRSD